MKKTHVEFNMDDLLNIGHSHLNRNIFLLLIWTFEKNV